MLATRCAAPNGATRCPKPRRRSCAAARLAAICVRRLQLPCRAGSRRRSAGLCVVGRSAIGEAVVALHGATGLWPAMLDIGGGWARQREPESRAPETQSAPRSRNMPRRRPAALRDALAPAGLAMPELWLEPGRYIVGNAVTLLARVGAIKRDAGMVWVHLDASTNDLMRIDTSQAWHHVLPRAGWMRPKRSGRARRRHLHPVADRRRSRDADAARAATCWRSSTPACTPRRSRTSSTPSRGRRRLLGAGGAEVIKRRETIADLFAQHAIPPRLARAGAAAQ